MKNIQDKLVEVIDDAPIISVSQKPINFGHNICVGNIGRSIYNLYLQVLIGLREVKTKYVAIAEDDVLYPKEHFEYRPPDNTLNYDVNKWALFVWDRHPIYSNRPGRRTMTSLISTTDTLREHLELRYGKYPTVASIPPEIYKYYWGEPGRFEGHIRLPALRVQRYQSVIPHVTFYTPESLGYAHLGHRKAYGPVQTDTLPFWGKASDVIKFYKE
jgi:hypothetical protein